MRALAADLLGVLAGGFVAVVAISDQELGWGQRFRDDGNHLGVCDPPEPERRSVVVDGLSEGRILGEPGDHRDDEVCGVVVEGEDGGEVCLRGARQSQPILFRSRVGTFVRSNRARPVFLHTHQREDAVADADYSVRARVLLGEEPHGRRWVAHQDALTLPPGEQLGGVLIAVAVCLRQIDRDDVVRRLRRQLRALAVVDHVVRRGDHILQAAGFFDVVMECSERFDLGHRGG